MPIGGLVILVTTVVTGLFYAVAVHSEGALNKYRVKSELRKSASAEHRAFLVSNLKFPRKTEKRDYLPLLIPLLGLMSIGVLQTSESTFALVLFSVLLLFTLVMGWYVLYLGITKIRSACENKYREWNPDRLRVLNLMTRSEVYFLLGTTTDATLKGKDCFELESTEVVAPDKLVPLLQRRSEIQAYMEVRDSVSNAIDNQESYLTPEQRERKEKLERDYRQSIQQFEPLLRNLIDATLSVHSHQVNQEKATVQEHVEKTLAESERRLRTLNGVCEVREKAETHQASVVEAIRDLNRVVQSERVSVATKKQAGDLIQEIILKKSDEEETASGEWVERDALAILEASRLHFGIAK